MDQVSRAQSSKANATSFKPGHPNRFAPGISGNPSGRPKIAHFTKIIKKIARKRENQEEIEQIMMDILRKRGMAAVLLLREMQERLEGKVVQTMEMEVNLSVSQRLEKAKERLALVERSSA